MASESTQMADLNKMAASIPAASVLPQTAEPPEPKDFKGCRCVRTKCINSNCTCFKGWHNCTSKCKCKGCANVPGFKGSHSKTEPAQWCKCTYSRCSNRNCHCVRASRRCTSRCECERCANIRGVRESDSDTEPEQADDTSIRKPTQMDSGGSSPNKRLRIR